MKYINLTKGKRAVVDDELYETLSRYRWCFSKGYAIRGIRVGTKQKTFYMHREIMDTPEGSFTDHVNGDTLDNRVENLRVCTKSENGRNRGAQRDNRSGFKGVFWHRGSQSWLAQLKHLGETFYLGLYKTREAAAIAYNKKAIELHGEFAKLNVIRPFLDEYKDNQCQ